MSSWRSRRRREAPIAARIDISRARPAPRASSRFATLAHAINRTRPVTVSRSAVSGRARCGHRDDAGCSARCDGGAVLVRFGIQLFEVRGHRADRGLRPRERDARMQAAHHGQPRRAAGAQEIPIGRAHLQGARGESRRRRRCPSAGPANPYGATPTMANGRPLTTIDCDTRRSIR